MKKVLFLFALLWGIFSAEAQVATHIFESKDAFTLFPDLKRRESGKSPVKQISKGAYYINFIRQGNVSSILQNESLSDK